ncbi:MAG TPA: hypothetical protein VHQ45_15525 [Gemmatimonadaceae bacterium]|nr:hypothetical protein [Gemmatimonadaceae bacterium]
MGQQDLMAPPDESQARVVLDARRIVHDTVHHGAASTFVAIQSAGAPAYSSIPAVTRCASSSGHASIDARSPVDGCVVDFTWIGRSACASRRGD